MLALIPAYNPRPAELAATLVSMLTQTTRPDICVVDDGSRPAVQIPDFARGRVQVLRLPINQGVSEALSAGVRHADEQGYKYICRLDVGDLSYPQRVERQLSFMESNPSVALVGAFARVVDLAGRTEFLHGVTGGPAAVAGYLRKNAPFRHSSFFIRTRSLVESGGYRADFNGAEDYELLLRLARRGPIDCLPETLIDYVQDPGGVSETRRRLQLRLRLAAQLAHFAPREVGAYVGVLRTLVVMVTPRGLARRATLWAWRRRTPEASSAQRAGATYP